MLLLTPGLAIRWGVLPFAYRVHALLAVSGICIALCLWAGFSLSELGLGRPSLRAHWIGCAALTFGLAAIMVLETHVFSFTRQQPVWLGFAPFYAGLESLPGGRLPLHTQTHDRS